MWSSEVRPSSTPDACSYAEVMLCAYDGEHCRYSQLRLSVLEKGILLPMIRGCRALAIHPNSSSFIQWGKPYASASGQLGGHWSDVHRSCRTPQPWHVPSDISLWLLTTTTNALKNNKELWQGLPTQTTLSPIFRKPLQNSQKLGFGVNEEDNCCAPGWPCQWTRA